MWQNHDAAGSRVGVLERDGHTCQCCGTIDWSTFLRQWNDRQHIAVWRHPAELDDWALALGLLDPIDHDAVNAMRWPMQTEHFRQRQEMLDTLPDSIRALVRSEKDMERVQQRLRYRMAWRGQHTLEANHIDPRRGGERGFGCWNHLDGLETLCKRCHGIVTGLQVKRRRDGLDDVVDLAEVREIIGARASKKSMKSMKSMNGAEQMSLAI